MIVIIIILLATGLAYLATAYNELRYENDSQSNEISFLTGKKFEVELKYAEMIEKSKKILQDDTTSPEFKVRLLKDVLKRTVEE